MTPRLFNLAPGRIQLPSLQMRGTSGRSRLGGDWDLVRDVLRPKPVGRLHGEPAVAADGRPGSRGTFQSWGVCALGQLDLRRLGRGQEEKPAGRSRVRRGGVLGHVKEACQVTGSALPGRAEGEDEDRASAGLSRVEVPVPSGSPSHAVEGAKARRGSQTRCGVRAAENEEAGGRWWVETVLRSTLLRGEVAGEGAVGRVHSLHTHLSSSCRVSGSRRRMKPEPIVVTLTFRSGEAMHSSIKQGHFINMSEDDSRYIKQREKGEDLPVCIVRRG